MPFVRIDLFEGRTEEQKIALAREVTEVVSRNTNAPKEAIHVFINDMPEGTYYPQGEMSHLNKRKHSCQNAGVFLCIKFYFLSSSSMLSTLRKASWGTSTDPIAFIRFFPAFCFSRSLRLRETSPP